MSAVPMLLNIFSCSFTGGQLRAPAFYIMCSLELEEAGRVGRLVGVGGGGGWGGENSIKQELCVCGSSESR